MSYISGMCHRYFDPDTAYKELNAAGESVDGAKAEERPYDRIFVIVLDSLGIGAMSDAEAFGDMGADTFGHICETIGELDAPNLRELGMMNLAAPKNNPASADPKGRYARLSEASASKDTMAGHWEMMGVKTTEPFVTFPQGFPQELVNELEERCGHKCIGNVVASGTVILDELGEQSIADDALILYTSADPVLQLAANEEFFGLEELYRCCEIAREITMRDEWKVGRVIARPFVGEKKGSFERTSNRRDYTVEPPQDTVLNAMNDAGYSVIGVGKIGDIFSRSGLTEDNHSESSVHGMEQTLEIAKRNGWNGLCFVNLVDFDSKWGHRRNPQGYAEEIEHFDVGLGKLMDAMGERDLVILCADHGNDPTYTGSDHTREYVPFIAYSPSMQKHGKMKDQDTFAVIGASVLDNFGVEMPDGLIGHSVLSDIR